MNRKWITDDKHTVKRREPETKEPVKQPPSGPQADVAQVTHLQQQVGNRAVQRLLAQRSADGSFELDDATANRINRARGGGQSLDSAVQASAGERMGHDFSGVRVHTGAESDDLNRQLNAKAFTTGQDIFFRQGAYDPGSSGGQELIAHELTHVVQQSSGAVSGGSKMTVNPPGDVYEQEADSIAGQIASAKAVSGGMAQRQEEEEVQAKAIQRQEEEEEVQAKAIQRQEEEEEVQAKTVQRQEEEELMMQPIQRQEEEEEVEM
jgi:hypothetical protein